MIFFNNVKFLLLLIWVTTSFQVLPSFFCCSDDTTIDTQIKPNKETGRSSLTDAIAKNQLRLKQIAKHKEKLESQESSTKPNKKTSSNESTVTNNTVENQKNNPNNQTNSSISQNLIPNASAHQIHTEVHSFNFDSGNEQNPLYRCVKNEDTFSPKENSNENNNNIAPQGNFDSNNTTIILPQTRPSSAPENNGTLQNSHNQPDDFVQQYQGVGVIPVLSIVQHPLSQGIRASQRVILDIVREDTLSGNNRVLYRSSTLSESNLPTVSILQNSQRYIDQNNNNIPHMLQEDFDNNQN